MNTNLGLIGTKLGNLQIFTDDGEVRRVTAVQTGPCTVISKRTPERDGYSALQLGFGSKRAKLVAKPQLAALAKAGIEESPRIVREFRVSPEMLEKYEVGQQVKASDLFTAGQFVDVQGTSKGRGFTGVMKRHNFSGAGTDGHGTHEYKRHGGSIGMNMTPGRVFKGMKMPGQHGSKKVTVMSMKVTKVLDDENILLIEGGVPGARNGFVVVRGASKKLPQTVA